MSGPGFTRDVVIETLALGFYYAPTWGTVLTAQAVRDGLAEYRDPEPGAPSPFPDEWRVAPDDLKAGLDYSSLSDDELTDVTVINVFPNLQISQQLEATYLIRFMPEPNEPTQFIYDSITIVPQDESGSLRIPDWVPPAAHEVAGDVRPDIERVPLGGPLDLGLLLNQDTEIVPVLQRGYKSRGFRGPLFSDQELRLKHFHAELDRYIAGERE